MKSTELFVEQTLTGPDGGPFTIGGHNNKKTFNDETTTILVDDVLVVVEP
jgi:hypothetical protein